MDETSEIKEIVSIEDQCISRFHRNEVPTLIIRPGDGWIMYSNPALSGLIKVHQADESIDKMSDILRKGSYTQFREEMVEVLKDPEISRECIVDLKEKMFVDEQQKVILTVDEMNGEDYIQVAFNTGSKIMLEVADLHDEDGDLSKLRSRISELEKYCEEKDTMYARFIHAVGHELKTPLTAIMGYAELLEYEFEQRDDPETKNVLKVIIKNSSRIYSYIEAAYHLSIQDLQSKKYKIADLDQVFKSIENELKTDLTSHNISLHFDQVKSRIKTNPTVLREILYQLILSEILYARVSASHIHVLYRKKGNEYHFSVMHTQTPDETLSENIIDRLNALIQEEEFMRATTIGYEFSKKMIEQAGGKIVIERGEGEMNSFYFILPQLK